MQPAEGARIRPGRNVYDALRIPPSVKLVLDVWEPFVHHVDVHLSMLRLSHNPMQARRYSMFAAEQCPKALAWMAALCAATGRDDDAVAWLVELMGVIVLEGKAPSRAGFGDRALRHTPGMS